MKPHPVTSLPVGNSTPPMQSAEPTPLYTNEILKHTLENGSL